jgi:hypothetical protein
MKAVLELPTFKHFTDELKRQGLAECRITGIIKDELTPEKPRMEYRVYYIILTALTKDEHIIRCKIRTGSSLIFEEESLKALHGLTVQKKADFIKSLDAEGISTLEGE